MSRSSEDLKAFGQPLDYPYLMGVYLAVNAVPDLGMLVDGPDCAVGKAAYIHGKHDRRSTLLDCEGRHRVACTFTDARNAALSREEAVRRALRDMTAREELSAVLVGALPLAKLTGTDYERLLREEARRSSKPALPVPARSLHGDWLDGYSEALNALARGVRLRRGRRSRRRAAVVGHLMDRGEADRTADAAELRRMLEGAGLEPVSVWLEGQSYGELSRAGGAGLIVSLPYGREAARILASRTGAVVVHSGLPFGLEASRRWLLQAARAAGTTRRAEVFVDAELAETARRLEWVVAHSCLNRRVWAAADPFLLGPMLEFLRELGIEAAGAASVGRMRRRLKSVLERPTSGVWRESLARAAETGLDVVIGCSDVVRERPAGCAGLETGFPSYDWHALSPSPSLGFRGAVAFADRFVNGVTKNGSHI